MEEYNNSSLISTKRDVQQLKKYWSNIKQQNKNILTAERQSRFLTGGGPQEAVNEIDPNVLNIVPDLMTTTPTISSSNLSTQESGEVLKAVRQNSFTKIIDIAKGEHSKNQQKLLTSLNEKINDIEMEIDDTLSTERWSSNESDIYIVEKENREKDPLNFEKNRRINTKSFPNSKKQKTERMTLICEKEMELADIKINHEIEMCKLKKEREEYINQITIEKLFLEKKELQERVKLAKFRAQKEM
ncbi:uncharacterized protein [Anoplolepis gracilipes]|uniref:uncharacterized protein isoform X1 n=1 Tax=Anoplolepis gracilipes TaxID=354296 RepID=UPI003B9EF3CB